MVCYEYVGFMKWVSELSSEEAAAWVGAIGTVVAIAVTAIFYAVDKWLAWSQRRREELDAAAKRRQDVEIHARLLLPTMMSAQRTTRAMIDALDGSSAYYLSPIGIGGPEVMVDFVDKLKYFEAPLANDLADFIAYAQDLNARLGDGARISDPEVIQLVQQLQIRVEASLNSLNQLTQTG